MTISQLVMTITKKEWRFIFLVTILVIVITTLPYLYGWLKTPADKIFTGIHFLNTSDYFVYYSYIEQASQGNILFHDLFTSPQSSANILNTVWIIPGVLSRAFDLSPVISFHLCRILFTPLLIIVGYLFISYIFDQKKLRMFVLTVFTFASGWGFYYLLYNNHLLSSLLVEGRYVWPLDIYAVEGNTFLTLYYSPHFIASFTLFILTLLLFFLALDNKKIIYGFYAGITALVLFSFHPFHLVTLYTVPLACLFVLTLLNRKINWSGFIAYLIMVVVSSPVYLYYLVLFGTDSTTRLKYFQNYCQTPSFMLVVFGYGALLILSITALIYLVYSGKIRNKKKIILSIWFIVHSILIFLPFSFQGRIVEGLSVPLTLLTGYILYEAYQKIKSKPRFQIFINPVILVLLFVLLFLVTPLSQVAIDVMIYNNARVESYLSLNQFEAIQWLKSNINNDEVTLSRNTTGNYIPAFSGKNVYIGHKVETISYSIKLMETEWFFKDNKNEQIERDFLEKRNIDYIFFGPNEFILGSYDPNIKQYLHPVYSNVEVTIYKVL